LEPTEYEAMYQLEDNLWWYRGQRRITKQLFDRFLPKNGPMRILDAGAGSGGSLPLLDPLGEVMAFDYSDMAVRFYTQRRPGRVAQASITHLPYADKSFDLVTIFDVLAILTPEEEKQALNEIARVLKPGGHLFWREPAHMLLHGPHDQATHVKHRYNKGEFRRLLRQNGLTPLRLSYSNSFLFPVAVTRRMIAKLVKPKGPPRSDVRPVPEPLNSLMAQLIGAEAPLVTRYGLPIGLSVLTLARKQ
jgi:ubiquinone/menaquinone biosynthesis C-methylase UbiE